MSIKKKLGLGVASAALGLSLVGGGTWAAFNDIETMSNSLAAGTLDLVIDQPATGSFKVSKLVPGDTIKREFEIQNNGNIDIDKVLLDTKANFVQGTKGADGNVPLNSSSDDYLKQFKVKVYTADGTNLLSNITGSTPDPNSGVTFVSLYDFVKATEDADDFNITSTDGLNNKLSDFNNKDSDTITIELEFVNDLNKNAGEYVQNKYMGNSVTLDFTFEATQKPGTNRSNN